jgi:hypothetical protein
LGWRGVWFRSQLWMWAQLPSLSSQRISRIIKINENLNIRVWSEVASTKSATLPASWLWCKWYWCSLFLQVCYKGGLRPVYTAFHLTLSAEMTLRQTCAPDEDRERDFSKEISVNAQSYLASMATPAPCGDGVGWTRIAYLNMTDPDQMCPSPWTLFTSGNKRVCFWNSSSAAAGYVVTLFFKTVPSRGIAKCVAASLDTNTEIHMDSTLIIILDIPLIPTTLMG